MQEQNELRLVLVTAPDIETARKIARAVLDAKTAACVNLLPGIESHYWWQSKLENSAETLMIFKSTTLHLEKLEQIILGQHPYDTPEIVALPVSAVSERYSSWWLGNLLK